MGTILIAVVAFIIAVGVLVTFHEYGHFWAARRLGVKVLQFSVGFGRKLFSWKDKKGTEYIIAAIPLGGYVKLLDEREDLVKEDELSFAFNRKPVWAKMLVVLAGPIFNFIFAIFAYWIMFMIGLKGAIPLVGYIQPNSIAAQSGIKAGDQIVAVDHVETRTWASVFKRIMPRLGDKDYLNLEVEDASGEIRSLNLNLNQWQVNRESSDLLYSLGIETFQMPMEPIAHSIMPGEPAEEAGFLAGDKIISVNGENIHTWQDFTKILEKNPNIPLNIVVKREAGLKTLVLTPKASKNNRGQLVGFAGIQVKVPQLDEAYTWVDRYNPWDAMTQSVKKTGQFISMSFRLIGKMIVGDVGLHNLSGPLTIAQGAGISFQIGFQQYLNFLALVSISLGVLNLLPIPILDGGHLLYYSIELVTGKPVSVKAQWMGYKIGMMLLIFLTTIAFYNDLMRMF